VNQRGLEIERCRLIEWQLTLSDVALVFGLVIGDKHQQIVCTNKDCGKCPQRASFIRIGCKDAATVTVCSNAVRTV
jgi:hypothetical protein